jgi:hypothetical protein
LLYIFMIGFSGALKNTIIYSKGIVSWLLGAIYYLLPHFDFYDMRIRITHDWPPIRTDIMVLITGYTIIYIGMLLWISSGVFRRRDI